jgi:hypothetical protein
MDVALRDPLTHRQAAEACIAGSVIRAVARRLVIEDDPQLREKALAALADAPELVLAEAFRLALQTRAAPPRGRSSSDWKLSNMDDDGDQYVMQQ